MSSGRRDRENTGCVVRRRDVPALCISLLVSVSAVLIGAISQKRRNHYLFSSTIHANSINLLFVEAVVQTCRIVALTCVKSRRRRRRRRCTRGSYSTINEGGVWCDPFFFIEFKRIRWRISSTIWSPSDGINGARTWEWRDFQTAKICCLVCWMAHNEWSKSMIWKEVEIVSFPRADFAIYNSLVW